LKRDKESLQIREGERSMAVEQHRRRDLLRATIAVIATRGIEGLRTREVAARAGVNISTLHYYFKTKEALLLAVLREVIETLTATVHKGSGVGHARDELDARLAGTLRSFRENPELATVLQELRLRSRRDAAARKAFRTLHSEWNRSIAYILRRGIKGGEMRPDIDPDAGAFAITSFIMGLTLQLWVNPEACDVTLVLKELGRWLSRS
jgi:AcrR family transcriptional regulator